MKKKTKTILWVIGVILAVGLIGFILVETGVVQQSILSSNNQINVDNGKVYWLYTLTANGIDEGLSFSVKPSAYTLTDGTTVTPQDTLKLYFSKSSSYCTYQMQENTYSMLLGIIKFKYYTLSNKERTVNIRIVDGNGQTQVLDGTEPSTATFTDSDGTGKVVVQTQGLLMGKQDCPEYSDVAIDFNRDNSPKFYSKSSYENYLHSHDFSSCGIYGTTIGIVTCIVNSFSSHVTQTSSFTSQFLSTPSIDSIKTRVTGEKSIGTVVFTVTADQDYFNSAIYSQPTQASPYVSSISIPDMKKDTTTSGYATIKNSNSNTGSITIKASSTGCSVTPTSNSVSLSSSYKQYFTIKAGSSIGQCCINVEVCPVSQLSQPDCDTSSKCASITENTPSVSCGNGKCDSTENYNTCPQDCPYNPVCGNGVCEATETNITCPQDCGGNQICQDKFGGLVSGSLVTTEGCYGGFLDKALCNIGLTKKQQKSECSYNYTIVIIMAILILVLGILALVLASKRARKSKFRGGRY